MEGIEDRVEAIRKLLLPDVRGRGGAKGNPLSLEHRREYMKEYMKDYRKSHPEYAARVDEAAKKWREENRELDNANKRERMRKHYVGTMIDGRHVIVKVNGKRPRPDNCELCSKDQCVLNYHHWIPSAVSVGMYLCFSCHMFAEAADRMGEGCYEKYVSLRAQIERECLARDLEVVS